MEINRKGMTITYQPEFILTSLPKENRLDVIEIPRYFAQQDNRISQDRNREKAIELLLQSL